MPSPIAGARKAIDSQASGTSPVTTKLIHQTRPVNASPACPKITDLGTAPGTSRLTRLPPLPIQTLSMYPPNTSVASQLTSVATASECPCGRPGGAPMASTLVTLLCIGTLASSVRRNGRQSQLHQDDTTGR